VDKMWGQKHHNLRYCPTVYWNRLKRKIWMMNIGQEKRRVSFGRKLILHEGREIGCCICHYRMIRLTVC